MTDVDTRPHLLPRNAPLDEWNALVGSPDADIVDGSDLVKDDALAKLVNVPFIITRIVFRPGVQRQGVKYRDDYASCEAVVAPLEVLQERVTRGRLVSIESLSVDPGEHIVFNDGSTGIYRQVVKYLYVKELIGLPEPLKMEGEKGACSFDLPRSQWEFGADEATAGFKVILQCPRGLRVSEYTNDYNPDGSRTLYIG